MDCALTLTSLYLALLEKSTGNVAASHPKERFSAGFFWRFLASGLGSGFFPWAPGTFASAAFVLIWLALTQSGLIETNAHRVFLVAALIAFALVSIRNALGSAKGERDPSYIVIDEWSGMAITLLAVPVGSGPWLFISAFALFRFFDIIKPGPVRWIERAPGALGVLGDDLLAGFFGFLSLEIVKRLIL